MKKRFAAVLFVLISVLALADSASADKLFRILVKVESGYKYHDKKIGSLVLCGVVKSVENKHIGFQVAFQEVFV